VYSDLSNVPSFHNAKSYSKSKTNLSNIDNLTIFWQNLVGVGQKVTKIRVLNVQICAKMGIEKILNCKMRDNNNAHEWTTLSCHCTESYMPKIIF